MSETSLAQQLLEESGKTDNPDLSRLLAQAANAQERQAKVIADALSEIVKLRKQIQSLTEAATPV